jgi:hypothetical protein
VFTARVLRLEDDWRTFCIKPEDGMELPAIMKWIKQSFAQRYSRLTGEPPENAGAALGSSNGDRPLNTGVRPWNGKNAEKSKFPPISPLSGAFPSG